jgi:hypothetical protein
MNLIIKGTKTKLYSRMECYSLCDLIMIKVNGPFVQYLLTFGSVDKGNHEAKIRENAKLAGSISSKTIQSASLNQTKEKRFTFI